MINFTYFNATLKKVFLAIILLYSGFSSVQAQDSTKYVFSWFDFEAGIGFQPAYKHPTAGKLGWGIQINRNLISFHLGNVGEFFRSHGEAGLLYGRVLTPLDSKFMGGLSTGISYASYTETQFGLFGGRSGSSSVFQGISFPVQANIQYRIFKHIALSSTLFITINKRESFGGLTAGILLGKFLK